MIITDSIKALVYKIEHSKGDDLDSLLQILIKELHHNCQLPENKNRYEEYKNSTSKISSYPVDEAGYAISFDPLSDEESFFAAFRTYNMVVGKQVISNEISTNLINRVKEIIRILSNGTCDITHPYTYDSIPIDENGTPIISRGFLELYHDDSLAQIRQSIRLYIHHVIIRGSTDLWTTFDRVGVKLPHFAAESKGLGLHVDQNPLVHKGFTTIQGILALIDCPLERGTFLAVPGSIGCFPEYTPMAKNMGEYVGLDMNSPLSNELKKSAQPIPLRKGDIVTRDSRMTHANTDNLSDDVRMVAMVAAGKAREKDTEICATRNEAYISGMGSNVRDALMHATQRPRYAKNMNQLRLPENFTYLGSLLYGREKYSSII